MLVLSVDHLRERLATRGDQIKVIVGHFPLCTTELIDGRYTTLTLLRDPVERMLSSLRHDREVNPAVRGMPIEEIYRAGGRLGELAHNQMVKVLALTPAEHAAMSKVLSLTPAELAARGQGPLVEFNRAHLERAKTRLAGIDAFGLQEHFEEFCDELSARYGWDLGEPEMVNTTAPVEVSDGLRAQIAEDNAFDIELYEFAKGLLRDAGRLHERDESERNAPTTG